MYKLAYILIVLLMLSCTSTKLTDSWRNPEHTTFYPKNVLVIGVAPDFEARSAFKFQLKNELNTRKINGLVTKKWTINDEI